MNKPVKKSVSLLKSVLNYILDYHYYHVWNGWNIHDHRIPTWIRECKDCGRVEHVDYAGYKQIIEEGDKTAK